MRGITPSPVTPFTPDGAIDYAAIQRLGSWLGSIESVQSLAVLGPAGEGTFLTQEEYVTIIKTFLESTDERVPVIASITAEGTEVAAVEAQRARAGSASAGLLYLARGWLRFGY